MKRCKRWISMMLSLAMIFSLVPMGFRAAAEEPEAAELHRYTVLILDASDEMQGAPAEMQSGAAEKLIDAAAAADGRNQVAVVTMKDTAETAVSFTGDAAAAKAAVRPAIGGHADFTLALRTAQSLLDDVAEEEGAEIRRNIVLFSQGIPTAGEASVEGCYTEKDHASQAFGNVAVVTADEIRAGGCSIATLGLFQNQSGNNLTFAQRVMQDVADEDCFREVTDLEELEFVFGGQPEPEQGPHNIRRTGVSYFPSFGGQDYATTYYYDDDYFTRSSYEYQDSLATMTLCLALSAFGSTKVPNTPEGYEDKSINLQQLLSDCGYPEENYATNDSFREKPQMDSIGVGASSKQILDDGEPVTLIAAAVRGGGYESEWASNFTLGAEGHHQGFAEARDQVLDFLSEYIEAHEITGRIKLWITGYSRAAATTTMVAGALDNAYVLSENVTLDPDDLFAYCYECPQGATNADEVNADRFQNIFNIVNPGDLVCKIAPSKPDRFGFQRYGVNCYLPTALKEGESYNALLDAMLEHYNDMPSAGEYIVDDFQMKKISVSRLFWDPSGALKEGIIVDDNDEKWDQNAFLDEVVFKLFNENVISRDNYVRVYQDDMRELCKVLFGSGDKWDKFPDVFLEKLEDKAPEIAACLLLNLERRLQSIVEHCVTDTLSELEITDYSPRQIKAFVVKVVALILPFGVNHPNLLVTTVANIKGIGYAHLPELCMAWLQSFDPNYTRDGHASFNSGIHRVIHVNCPVDVRVYDEAGNLVASILGDESQKIEGSAIVSYVSDEGEKLVYLPADAAYEIELLATGEGVMNYSIQEYSEEVGGVNRLLNYYDVALTDGAAYQSIIPAMTAADQAEQTVSGSTAAYVLLDAEGNEIPADEEFTGEDAVEANAEVTVTSNDEALGVVQGGGIVKIGSYVKLTAIPNENCSFIGWFQGDELLSEELEYRFCVTEDMTIEGRFEAGEEPEETEPVETEPVETEPVETEPVETEPVETEPVETEPVETEPVETEPVETEPVETEPEATEHEHVFGEWVTVKEPTSKEEGLAERRCACGEVETKVLPKLVNTFTDVKESDYFYESVLWAVNKGITAGTGPDTFSPNQACTRAQIVTFLWRAAGSPEVEKTENPFTDVKESDYFYKSVLWAVQNGITAGITETSFGPGLPCTRAHIVTFLYRFAAPEDAEGECPFTDVSHEDYFFAPVIWAVENGITSGVSEHVFGSVLFCTRAQAVTFLHSLMTR